MGQRQKDFFKERLIQWRDSLMNVQNRCSTQLDEENARVPDISDQVAESANRNMAYINEQRSQLIISQINAALQRIEDGIYGYCSESGEEIGLRRLLAWPIATMSVSAQERGIVKTTFFSEEWSEPFGG